LEVIHALTKAFTLFGCLFVVFKKKLITGGMHISKVYCLLHTKLCEHKCPTLYICTCAFDIIDTVIIGNTIVYYAGRVQNEFLIL